MINNFEELAATSLRRSALRIAGAGYKVIKIEEVLKNRIKRRGNILNISYGNIKKRVDLSKFEKVFIIGVGKGSALACSFLGKTIGGKLSGGAVIDVLEPEKTHQAAGIKYYEGTHPIASEENVRGTREIVKIAKNLTEKDLLFVFVCGGGSALAVGSKKEVRDVAEITKALTKRGADIFELNTLRKHLSEIKGGGLAKIAYPGRVISLIASDVLGNDISMVASGPTVKDKTTVKDAERVLRKYGLDFRKFDLKETPKDSRFFRNIENILFVSNRDAILGMKKEAERLGFKPRAESLMIQGEARRVFLPFVKNIKQGEAILAAGESTVTLNKKSDSPYLSERGRVSKSQKIGKGGRNQEAVLGTISNLKSKISKDVLFISFASDGYDNTEAAGAIGDSLVLKKAEKLKLNPREFLDNHDSFTFFKKTGDLIYAERKSFNVADLMMVMRFKTTNASGSKK